MLAKMESRDPPDLGTADRFDAMISKLLFWFMLMLAGWIGHAEYYQIGKLWTQIGHQNDTKVEEPSR